MSLPSAVKLNLPGAYDGTLDVEVLDSFFFTVERYFELTKVTDDHQQGQLLALLVKDHAAVWLRAQGYDFSDVGYSDIKADMLHHFTPADHERRARDALAKCHQHHPTQVSGYIAEFIRAAQRVANLSEDEKLDRFLRGLRGNILEKVLMSDVDSFADACRAAERASAILSYVQDRSRRPMAHPQPQHSGWNTSHSTFRGPGPMVLGNVQGHPPQRQQAGRRQQPRGNQHNDGGRQWTGRGPQQQYGHSGRLNGENRRCYNCGRIGHLARDCRVRSQRNGQAHLNFASRSQHTGSYPLPVSYPNDQNGPSMVQNTASLPPPPPPRALN